VKAVALVLIILGFLAVAYQGFTYVTREKVVDLGPIEVTQERHKRVILPPVVGAVALAVDVDVVTVVVVETEAVAAVVDVDVDVERTRRRFGSPSPSSAVS